MAIYTTPLKEEIETKNKSTVNDILFGSFIAGVFDESVLHEFDANGEEDNVEDDEDYTLDDDDQENQNDDQDDNQDEETPEDNPDTDNPDENGEYELEDPDAENQDQADETQVEDRDPNTEEDPNEGEDAGDEGEYTLEDPDAQPEGDETQPDDNTNPEDPNVGGEDAGDEEYSLDDPDNANSGTGEQETEDKLSAIAQIEKDLFEKLTPEQKEIKIKALKQNYVDLYNKCDGILEMITDSNPGGEEEAQLFDFIQKTLVELQDNCHDYLTYTFDTKSYLDNDAQFKQYLVILNSVKKILEEFTDKKPE